MVALKRTSSRDHPNSVLAVGARLSTDRRLSMGSY